MEEQQKIFANIYYLHLRFTIIYDTGSRKMVEKHNFSTRWAYFTQTKSSKVFEMLHPTILWHFLMFITIDNFKIYASEIK